MYALLVLLITVLGVAFFFPADKKQYAQSDEQVQQPANQTTTTSPTTTSSETDNLDDAKKATITPKAKSEDERDFPSSAYSSSTPKQATHIEVVDACNSNYQGGCLNVRQRPATSSPVVTQLRNHIVLKVATTTQAGGRLWYQTEFAEWLRYPDRVSGQWWVAGEFVRPLQAKATETTNPAQTSSGKAIIIDLSEQKLKAVNADGTVFMEEPVSTGKPLYPTPRGRFPIFKMTPTRYMQGPIDGITDQKYDLPGVPWNLYFTYQGAVIHGAYWHNNFGQVWSNGCVNLPPAQAKKLYRWAELGTEVVVQN
jgi:lipoprotein-anchoring transpeptidase ErfK/SrfK